MTDHDDDDSRATAAEHLDLADGWIKDAIASIDRAFDRWDGIADHAADEGDQLLYRELGEACHLAAVATANLHRARTLVADTRRASRPDRTGRDHPS